jgi:hypothetical protein
MLAIGASRSAAATRVAVIRPTLGLAALVAVAVILAAATLTRGHRWGDDFAGYVMQAASLVDGRPSEFVRVKLGALFHVRADYHVLLFGTLVLSAYW